MSLKQKIEQKALDMLNRVDDERGLTIIEKGNVKRFLSYYVDDVVGLLDKATEQILFRLRTYVKTVPVDMAISIVEQELGVEGRETKK